MNTETNQQAGPQRDKINGVFSSQEVRKVGTGTTTRKTIQKTFWFCVELNDDELEVQPLNPNYIPAGPKKIITREKFLSSFSPEPELYVSNVYPQMRELNKTIARADRHRDKKELFSAEMEYGNALKVDEENVRANFGLGITYLERGEGGKAENIFERLVRLDAAFEEQHKHLFNEFGIKLRKNGMIDQAVTYYERAMELATQDENLLYNLARAYLENKNVEKALEYLLKALEVNPLLEPGIKFLQWLAKKGLLPEDKKPLAAAALLKVKKALSEGATLEQLPEMEAQPITDPEPPSAEAIQAAKKAAAKPAQPTMEAGEE